MLLQYLQVKRQHEEGLIRAVNELCDGNPSDETLAVLRSLDRPVEDPELTRLYGTNFDAAYINQIMLEEMDGESHTYKAVDQGNSKLLRCTAVAKTIALKAGAPVILIKNLGEGLFNGTRGKVHKVSATGPPIINFNGKFITLNQERFEIFDKEQNTVLACRVQYPVMLAFALTVHRAQGQTLPFVEVDCFSFFAPGQMGVAIGRATSTDGLCVRNFNLKAAHLKHPQCVYDFYEKEFQPPLDDLSCCRKHTCLDIDEPDDQPPGPEDQPSTSQESETTATQAADRPELPQLDCPWSVQEFLKEMKSAPFLSCVSSNPNQDKLEEHTRKLYHKVHSVTSKPATTPQQWSAVYAEINTFLVSDEHILLAKELFEVETLTKEQNKLSSKLVFWLMDKVIKTKADEIVKAQTEKLKEKDVTYSAAGKAKVRYLAGACVHKILTRLQESVTRKLGTSTKAVRLQRKMDYKKRAMLKHFRISEAETEPEIDESMTEITYKQGPSKGLNIVGVDVFQFFLILNATVQKNLTPEYIHLHSEHIHASCRNVVDDDIDLVEKWLQLFGSIDEDDIEDEVLLTLFMELFRDVTEHFIRITLVDALKEFKRTVPRRKKQALRAKITALGQSSEKKRKVTGEQQAAVESDSCGVCDLVCEWEPATVEFESIACDTCNGWYHYKCVNLTGGEAFLKRKSVKWFCSGCSKKGKGKGKGKK
jgi:hypothetical protein